MEPSVELNATSVQLRHRRRAIAAAVGGALVENYDHFLYGILVVAISASLFPPGEDATLGALATFAITFVARPVGAVIFGRIADRRGRRSAMILALVAMTIGTVLVGVIPTYERIGPLAVSLLIGLRLLQGVSMGGEQGSASVFVGEYAPRRRRGLFSSFVFVTAQCGIAVAIGVVLVLQSIMSPDAFTAWGWRIAFLLAAAPAVVIIYIRLRVEDTPVFRAAKEAEAPKHASLVGALRTNWRQIIQIAGLAGMAAPYYLIAVYFPIYLTDAGLSQVGATLAILIITLVLGALIPLAGLLGDRIGRKRILIASGAGMMIVVIPAFSVLRSGMIITAILGGILIIAPLALYFGAFSAALSEMFTTESRGTGANVGYNVGASAFAALPFVVAAISSVTDDRLVPAYCVFVVAGIGLTAAASLPGARLTGAHDLDDTGSYSSVRHR